MCNQLYEQLRIFQNLFQPSMKLNTKIRKGSRVIRRYDQACTPWQRVLKSSGKTLPQLQALKAMLKNTDPFELSRNIDQQRSEERRVGKEWRSRLRRDDE